MYAMYYSTELNITRNFCKLVCSYYVHFLHCRGFTNGAVDVLNVQSFVISNSTFQNGTTPDDNGNIRADSGGLALRYFQNNIGDFNANVCNCNFMNGTAGRHLDTEPIFSRFLARGINSGINQNQFTGRGGGMGVYINTINNSSVTVNVKNCLFKNNYAEFFGGGIYLYLSGGNLSNNHTISLEDTHFVNNSVVAGGGAIQMALLIQNLDFPGSQFSYTNCTFISNRADYGGAMNAIQAYVFGRGNIVDVKECNFVENSANRRGSAISFASLLYPENVEDLYSYSITNWYVGYMNKNKIMLFAFFIVILRITWILVEL